MEVYEIPELPEVPSCSIHPYRAFRVPHDISCNLTCYSFGNMKTTSGFDPSPKDEKTLSRCQMAVNGDVQDALNQSKTEIGALRGRLEEIVIDVKKLKESATEVTPQSLRSGSNQFNEGFASGILSFVVLALFLKSFGQKVLNGCPALSSRRGYPPIPHYESEMTALSIV